MASQFGLVDGANTLSAPEGAKKERVNLWRQSNELQLVQRGTQPRIHCADLEKSASSGCDQTRVLRDQACASLSIVNETTLDHGMNEDRQRRGTMEVQPHWKWGFCTPEEIDQGLREELPVLREVLAWCRDVVAKPRPNLSLGPVCPAMPRLLELNTLFLRVVRMEATPSKDRMRGAIWVAAPVLIAWVGFVLWKALHDPSPSVLADLPHPSNMYALSITSSFIIGFAVWGNEQDYWRYSKPGVWHSAIPLFLSIAIGQILFPLAGWFIARASGSADYSSTLAFMSNYCFGGIAIIGLLILTADYFSTNDSSLFGSAVALESFLPLKHSWSVCIFTIFGALIAALLSITDMTQSFSIMVSLNCIILPTPTIIMITEWWLSKWVFRQPQPFANTDNHKQLPVVNASAIISLLVGIIVGLGSSGIFPPLEFCHIGICALNAWVVSIIIYIPLRIYEHSHNHPNVPVQAVINLEADDF